MIAECVMKVNGKWYQAGEEIPADTTITKKDIQSMNVQKLRKFAKEQGLNDKDLTASELKTKLIDKLGL